MQGLQEDPVHRPEGLAQQDVVSVDSNPGLARGRNLRPKDDACAHSALFANRAGDGLPVVETVLDGDHDAVFLQQRRSLRGWPPQYLWI